MCPHGPTHDLLNVFVHVRELTPTDQHKLDTWQGLYDELEALVAEIHAAPSHSLQRGWSIKPIKALKVAKA